MIAWFRQFRTGVGALLHCVRIYCTIDGQAKNESVFSNEGKSQGCVMHLTMVVLFHFQVFLILRIVSLFCICSLSIL
jgi:hypothetical protein